MGKVCIGLLLAYGALSNSPCSINHNCRLALLLMLLSPAGCAPWTLLAWLQGTSWVQHLQGIVWGLSALTSSLLDWPLRNISRGVLAGVTRPVRSSTLVSAGDGLDITIDLAVRKVSW
jgi:hypothetical protein